MRIWDRISTAWRVWESALPRCAQPNCEAGSRRFFRQAGTHLQGTWYCSPQCLEKAARQHFMRAAVAVLPTPRAQHRVPLGLLMLSRGHLDNSQLRSALQAQRRDGRGRIGHWLEKLGFATEQQVTAALGLQWACPVVPPLYAGDLDCARLLPFRLMQQFRMLPIHFSRVNRVIFVAFSEGVDYTALYAIEQMLECRTEACVVSSSAMTQVLERMAHARRSGELLFEGWRDANEMAHITCGCMLKLGARAVRIVACGGYVWVRLTAESGQVDLLFRRGGCDQEAAAGISSTQAIYR
jgi:Type II secretion system (T2SS), protein E, N-terminal domain